MLCGIFEGTSEWDTQVREYFQKGGRDGSQIDIAHAKKYAVEVMDQLRMDWLSLQHGGKKL